MANLGQPWKHANGLTLTLLLHIFLHCALLGSRIYFDIPDETNNR